MTTFEDGPAAGQTLMLRRHPVFLRVVVDAAGKWDALDQLADRPALDEEVHVYRLVETGGMVCIRRKVGGGCFKIGRYKLHDVQPPRPFGRVQSKWEQWAGEQYAAWKRGVESSQPMDTDKGGKGDG